MKNSRSGRWANPNLGMLLLAIWLIATGLLPLLKISFPSEGVILAVLAIAAGVLLLVGTGGVHLALNADMGMLLLAIWLILEGAMVLLRISFPQSDLVMALLAVAAGALILLRR